MRDGKRHRRSPKEFWRDGGIGDGDIEIKKCNGKSLPPAAGRIAKKP